VLRENGLRIHSSWIRDLRASLEPSRYDSADVVYRRGPLHDQLRIPGIFTGARSHRGRRLNFKEQKP
jgi:hypothetical protein